MKRLLQTFWSRYRNVLLLFISSRVIVFAAFALTIAYGVGEAHLNQWDAAHYLYLADHGYQSTGSYTGTGSFIAFLPGYPVFIHALHLISGLNSFTAALLISNLCALFAMILLYDLAKSHFSGQAAETAVALLAFHPMSLFLSVPYTESMFLLSSLLTIRSMQQKQWGISAIAIAVAFITRLTGIILIPLLCWQLWQKKASWKVAIAVLFFSLLPFSLFLLYQYYLFGTPLAFLIAQRVNWYHELAWPITGLVSIFSYAVSNHSAAIMWRVDSVMVSFVLITLFLSYRKIPSDILLFGWEILLVTLSQTFIIGASRYLLMAIPVYIYWGNALATRPILRQSVLNITSAWLAINTILFVLSKNVL